MLSDELLTQLRQLSHTDKLRVVQLLVNEFAHEEGIFAQGAEYEVWSPYDAAGAAEQLTKMLDTEN